MLMKASVMPQKTRLLKPVGLFLLGISALILRNPDPLINPIVFAEDGNWTGVGLTEGWLYALVYTRPDYLVVINILLLCLATKVSTVIAGDPLSVLPQAIAFISYSFYAALPTLAYFTIRRIATTGWALLGFLLILLLPLGTSQNEIIGRLLQIGFYMPFLALLLIFWRDRVQHRYSRFFIDLLLALSTATNPAVCPLIVVYLVSDFLKDWNLWLSVKRTITLIVPLLIFVAFMLTRLGVEGGLPGSLVRSNAIETFLARTLLYPLVFPWYKSLNNYVVVILTPLLGLLVFYAYKKCSNSEAKKLIVFTSITIAIYLLATITNRPGLTQLLSRYQVTFPDRYFMGINALTSFLIAVCISQLFKTDKLLSYSLATAITAIYVFHVPLIFETTKSALPLKIDLNFADQICLSYPSGTASGISIIQIYPPLPGWKITVPDHYINKANCPSKKP